MMRVLISTGFRGLHLSDEALLRLIELGVPVIEATEDIRNNAFSEVAHPDACIYHDKLSIRVDRKPIYMGHFPDMTRADARLIQVFEELGQSISNRPDEDLLMLVEVPDGTFFDVRRSGVHHIGPEEIIERQRIWSKDGIWRKGVDTEVCVADYRPVPQENDAINYQGQRRTIARPLDLDFQPLRDYAIFLVFDEYGQRHFVDLMEKGKWDSIHLECLTQIPEYKSLLAKNGITY